MKTGLRYRQNREFTVKKSDNTILLSSTKNNRGVCLNDTAFIVFKLCASEQSTDDIVSTLAAAYPEQKASIRKDVITVINSLVENGVLIPIDGSQKKQLKKIDISCICPTYARTELLEESIESFLRQDFIGTKELIIVNDFIEQEIVFEHPEIRIYNTRKRFDSLGEKYNAMFAMARGEYLTPWEDDDIFLPHRLSYAMEKIRKNDADYHKLPLAYCWNEKQITEISGNLFYCAGMWSKKLFDRTNGCDAIDTSTDVSLENQLAKYSTGYCLEKDADPENIYYIYRWAGVTVHLSGFGDDPDALAKAQSQLRRNVRRGRIELHPGWQHDYPKLCRDFLKSSL